MVSILLLVVLRRGLSTKKDDVLIVPLHMGGISFHAHGVFKNIGISLIKSLP
jgi:hypothetical protein